MWLPCVVSRIIKKKHVFVFFKLINPITVVFIHLFWGVRPFWLATSFPVAHFGCWTLISEAIAAGWTKVAAKISNWLGTRSHSSHLSGALVQELWNFAEWVEFSYWPKW